ncbi:MAG: hypothetical protein ACTH6F_02915, partial [Halomonas sp.]
DNTGGDDNTGGNDNTGGDDVSKPKFNVVESGLSPVLNPDYDADKEAAAQAVVSARANEDYDADYDTALEPTAEDYDEAKALAAQALTDAQDHENYDPEYDLDTPETNEVWSAAFNISFADELEEAYAFTLTFNEVLGEGANLEMFEISVHARVGYTEAGVAEFLVSAINHEEGGLDEVYADMSAGHLMVTAAEMDISYEVTTAVDLMGVGELPIADVG